MDLNYLLSTIEMKPGEALFVGLYAVSRTAGRRAGRSTAGRQPSCSRPGTGTVVSLPWMRPAASTWRRISSTIRASAAAQAPTRTSNVLAGKGRSINV